MASSDNQGLQIALIIFVMLTIVLSVTTFVFFKQYEQADQRSVADAAKATKAESDLRAVIDETTALKKTMGFSDQAKLPDIQAGYAEDKKNLMAAIPEDKQFYRQALEYTYNTLHERDQELAAARLDIESVKEDRAKVEQAKQAQVAAAEAKQQQAEDALKEANKIYEAERAKKDQQLDALKAEMDKKNQEMTELADAKKREIDAVTQERNKFASTNKLLNARITEIDPTSGFEVPDGKILWVNQKARAVWINVGQADGLQRQVTFSVVGSGEDIGGDQKTKGRIEVTEILAPHFAEARILEDELYDPIVQDDKIFTPLWQPGRAESFAIIGGFDLDGDGEDDRDMIKDMIRMAGGRIDAEVTQDGKQTGNVSVNTRYLIMGTPPVERTVLEGAFANIQTEAERDGVRILTIDKFLDHVGWKNPKQVLRFGRRGNVEEVPAEQPDGGRPAASGNVSDLFRTRRPPGRAGAGEATKKSAY